MNMEVADAASARASGNNGSKKWPAGLSCGGAVAMSATSLLFAWLAVGTLRRCSAMDEEEVFSGVLWGLSPLIWAYLYSWTAALSEGVDSTVFWGTACLLFLAAAADKLIGPIAGAAAIVVAPLCSACACGRALAERRQRAGTERWSAATVASTPFYQSRAEEREERERKVHAISALGIVAVSMSAGVGFLSWAAPPEAKWPELEAPPTEVVFYLAGPLFLAVRLMMPSLVESPFMANVHDMRVMAAVIGAICWIIVVVSAGALFGTIIGTVVVWMGELGMVGFLGYFLAVEEHYEQLMVIERRKPRRAKDASGLLDGRDTGDACSAHIDPAGSSSRSSLICRH